MNILFLTSWYPTKSKPNLGVFVQEHAQSLRYTDNSVVLVALVVSNSKKLFKLSRKTTTDGRIETIVIEVQSRFSNSIHYLIPLQYMLLKRELKKILKSGFQPDIVHANVIHSAGIMGHWISRKLNIPLVITEHWSKLEGFLEKPVLARWGVAAYKHASTIMPVSKFLKDKIHSLIPDLSESSFQEVGNVVDYRTFAFKEKRQPSKPFRFCAIATWNNKKVPDKLPGLFINALSAFQKTLQTEVLLSVVGGGDQLLELKELCASENIQATFTDFLKKNEIVSRLHEADFFIHASSIETFGVVVAEALMCGVPVVCSRVGALPELVNDSNGVLCDNSNIDDWVTGLESITSKKFDHKLISDNIKKEFSSEAIGQKFNKIYKSCLEEA